MGTVKGTQKPTERAAVAELEQVSSKTVTRIITQI